MNVEDARYRYLSAASIAFAFNTYADCDRYWLWVEANSVRLDCVIASQFAEFKPSVLLTTPPEDRP